MGIYRSDYIIYGWKIKGTPKTKDGNPINFFGDKFLPYVEGHPGIEHIIVPYVNPDGNSGRDTVFGLRLAYSTEGWNFQNLNFGELDAEEVKAKYKELFDEEVDTEPEILIFTHLS